MRLAGKVAVITGAGSGQGKVALQRFIKEGAAVLGADVDEAAVNQVAATARADGGRAEAIRADVSDAGQVAAMIERAVEAFGRIDVLYNNAAIFLGGKDVPVSDLDEDVWDRVIDVNLKSIFLCCKYAIPHLVRAGGGSIINISSGAGLIGSERAHAYTASKGGVIALTRAIAVSYGRHNIRCNAICPGAVLTPMLDHTLSTEELRQKSAARYPIKRLGTPEDIVNLAVYLASDESSWMTGSIIPLDGGITAR
ncbi:MAG TPA: SDR family NAD(P)-dependent oxidoreductase [Dehalococcoidia bacterium]|nr:SDR family NAD(P)-dependent oxidoreductase [Dehalococcoidia bacterium]